MLLLFLLLLSSPLSIANQSPKNMEASATGKNLALFMENGKKQSAIETKTNSARS